MMRRQRPNGNHQCGRGCAIKRKVEFDDIDHGLPQETQRASAGVVAHQCRHGFGWQMPSRGDPRRLQAGVCNRDVWIEARPRGGHRVDGHRRVGGQVVEGAVDGGSFTNGGEQSRIAGPEVAARAGGRIVAVSRGRGPGLEVLW